jgi:hypothetical protein
METTSTQFKREDIAIGVDRQSRSNKRGYRSTLTFYSQMTAATPTKIQYEAADCKVQNS